MELSSKSSLPTQNLPICFEEAAIYHRKSVFEATHLFLKANSLFFEDGGWWLLEVCGDVQKFNLLLL